MAVDTRCPFVDIPPFAIARERRRDSLRSHFDKMQLYLRSSWLISCINDLIRLSIKIAIKENSNNKEYKNFVLMIEKAYSILGFFYNKKIIKLLLI